MSREGGMDPPGGVPVQKIFGARSVGNVFLGLEEGPKTAFSHNIFEKSSKHAPKLFMFPGTKCWKEFGVKWPKIANKPYPKQSPGRVYNLGGIIICKDSSEIDPNPPQEATKARFFFGIEELLFEKMDAPFDIFHVPTSFCYF